MSKRANGEGSFFFDEKKQIYRAMITTPAGKRLTKASKNEDIVKDWLNEQRLLVGRGQHIEPHGMTLGEWIDQWLEVYAKNSVRPRTYDRYVSLLAHAEPLRKKKIIDLLPVHFQKLYNELSDLSGTTKKHIHYCLSGCLRQAVINRLIHNNPIDNVEAPKSKPKTIEIFSDKELAAILKAAENYKYSTVIHIAIGTGMRISEILALQWGDINLTKATITVRRTVHYSNSQGTHICEPKTDNSRRTIKVNKATLLKLKEHRLKTQGDLLFTAAHGGILNPQTYLRWYWDKVRKEAGITKGFHAFRHTHATQLIESGEVSIQDVSSRLGHSRTSTTLDIYTHATKVGEEKVINALDNIMNRISEQK